MSMNFMTHGSANRNLEAIIDGYAVVKEKGIAERTLRNMGFIFSHWLKVDKAGESVVVLVKPSKDLAQQFSDSVGRVCFTLSPASHWRDTKNPFIHMVARDYNGIGRWIVAQIEAETLRESMPKKGLLKQFDVSHSVAAVSLKEGVIDDPRIIHQNVWQELNLA